MPKHSTRAPVIFGRYDHLVTNVEVEGIDPADPSQRELFRKNVMQLVLMAYHLGVPVQVGLIKIEKMQVDWVQLPKARVPPKKKARRRN